MSPFSCPGENYGDLRQPLTLDLRELAAGSPLVNVAFSVIPEDDVRALSYRLDKAARDALLHMLPQARAIFGRQVGAMLAAGRFR